MELKKSNSQKNLHYQHRLLDFCQGLHLPLVLIIVKNKMNDEYKHLQNINKLNLNQT